MEGRLDTFLGRALTDAATGLPNYPYFQMIQDWEERRARRRKTLVRVVRVEVAGGGPRSRKALMWRLCQELRTSDLIASEGRDRFHILLTTPDAENAEAIAQRVEQLGTLVRVGHAEEPEPLTVATAVHVPTDLPDEKGPCEPCDDHELTPDSSGTLFQG